MNYIEQQIIVQTGEDSLPGIAASVGGPLLTQLEKTVRPCVRMALTGRSGSVGHPPHWLRSAWDFRALNFESKDGDIVLHVRVPRLGDAAPRVFEQKTLWDEGVKESETAIDLLGKLVHDVRSRASGSDMYDGALLKRLTGWSGLLSTKIRSLRLPQHGALSPASELDASVIVAARELGSRIPPPRQIRLVGTIDMVRWSTRSLAIRTDHGTEYRCSVIDEELGDLGQYGGREVTILGKAIYRPSGTVLRLDVQQILGTTVGRAVHSTVPASFERKTAVERRRQTEKTGVSAIFGTWPGDETDDELLEALAEIRR